MNQQLNNQEEYSPATGYKKREKKNRKKEKEFYKNNSDPTASLIQPLWHKYVNSVFRNCL